MAVLVTGGKGYLGSEVVSRLVAQGHEVVCLDLKTTPGRLGALANRVTMLGGGLGGVERLETVIRDNRVERVAHMVFVSSSDDPSLVHDEVATMVMGTTDVYEATRRTGVVRVVFPSSIHYYGPQWLHGDVLLDENAAGLATTLYGVSKKLNEAVARAYAARAGMSIMCLRLPAIYGPKAMVGARGVNLAAVKAARGEPVLLPYPPDQLVCVAHVGDVADLVATVLLAESPRHLVYNVGGHTVSYWSIAAQVKEFVPDADIRFDLTAGPSDLPYLIDDSRARDELGLRHRSLREGLLEVIKANWNAAERGALEGAALLQSPVVVKAAESRRET
jgi:UDP-glucose 4-epimerase